MKKIILSTCTLFLIVLMIVRGQDVVLYAHRALGICYEMIIPTLFPFFICSGILVYSGFCESVSKIFAPVMQPLFGINPSGSAAFVLGIISGYPLGALTACQLYSASYLSKKEAERLLAFCNNSGPLFILCSVGLGLFSDIKIGIFLYVAHILGAFSVGIILKFISRPVYNPKVGNITAAEKNTGEIFSAALSSAVSNILTVCGSIVFFTVAGSLAMDLIPDFSLKSVIYGILEISNGNTVIAGGNASLAEKLILSCIITGFAGICVHIQVLSITASYGLKLRTYIIGKIMHGLLSGLYAFIIIKLMPAVQIKETAFMRIGGGFFFGSIFVLLSALAVLACCVIPRIRKCSNQRRSAQPKPRYFA